MKKITENIYMFPAKLFASHTYLVIDKFPTLIDPGTPFSFKDLKKGLSKLKLKPEDIRMVLNTHEHIDHTMSNNKFRHAVVIAHEETTKFLEKGIKLKDGFDINLGKTKLRIIYTPGHSKGSICFYEPKQKILFSGDTVFAHGTPSLITPSGSKKEYKQSLNKLLSLDIKKILPAHGVISETPKEDIKLILEKIK